MAMLTGTRIIEVEGLGPAPFAGMLLADLGADVIVIHRKDSPPASIIPEQSVLDRGKRSLALDLKNDGDIHTFKQLISTADGLIEGFRPGVMERLGIGPDPCLSLNPKLVYGRMTGWGQNGTLSETAGHDLNYAALSGALWYASLAKQPPVTPPTLVGDIGGGALYLVIGMLAGILNARNTGEGTVVDAAIVDGSAHAMNLLMAIKQSGNLSTQRGESLLDGAHWSRSYQTLDNGYISVQCLEPKFYAIFLDKMGLTDDPSFSEQFNRATWPELTQRLVEIFKNKTRTEWAEIFAGSDACVAPVLNPEEAMSHPHNQSRQIWHTHDEVLQAAPAPRFSGDKTWQPKTSPIRDQHREEILTELNMLE